MRNSAHVIAPLTVALAAAIPASAVRAGEWPERPVRFIVAYPAGGATDGAARILAERLGTAWGQPIVVENRPGAAGRIGLALAAKSPHSYTFVAATNSTINEQLTRGEDGAPPPAAELQPVSTIFTTPVALLVNRQAAPVDDLAQYITLARGKPGAVSYGSSGEGTVTHFFGELLKREERIDVIHIPFAGEGPNLSGLVGGHVTSAFLSASGAIKAGQTGKTRALAVTTPAGSALLPGVPSFAQLGITGLDRDSWVGLFAPVGTPQTVLDRAAQDIAAVLASEDVRQRYTQLGLMAEGDTPADLARRVEDDREYWGRVIRQTGIVLR